MISGGKPYSLQPVCFCGSGKRYGDCHGLLWQTDREKYAAIRAFMLANRQLIHVVPGTAPGSLHGRQLVYVHIPKSGGTTLDRILVAIARKYELDRFRVRGTVYGQFMGSGKEDVLDYLAAANRSKLASAAILSGHVPALFWEPSIDGRRAAYTTILRDPVERTMSHYLFGVGRGGWSSETSIENLVHSRQLLDNLQVRMLAGSADGREPCSQAMLERALANLETRFALVGVSDRFDQFLAALLTLYGWPDIIYSRYNVGNTRLPEARQAALRTEAAAFNTFDAALLARVREHGEVWINRVEAATPPPRSHELIVPLAKEGKFACFSRDEISSLIRIANESNCELTHA
jgi:SEC-C motif